MKNIPIEYEYFSKKLNQRLKFIGKYSGFKKFGNKNSPTYAVCFRDISEKSTNMRYRDHAFVIVPFKIFELLENNDKDVVYEFTAVVKKYKNKLTKKYYYITESYGLENAKKIKLLEEDKGDS